mgnify:CR=1 FL=1
MHEINDRSRDIGPFVPGPDDDMIICRCEEVTKGEIRTMECSHLRRSAGI